MPARTGEDSSAPSWRPPSHRTAPRLPPPNGESARRDRHHRRDNASDDAGERPGVHVRAYYDPAAVPQQNFHAANRGRRFRCDCDRDEFNRTSVPLPPACFAPAVAK
jgi:hypothetical protein